MKVYAVRKRRGQWAICSDENVLLQFENYDEAVQTARSAVEVLSDRDRTREAGLRPVQPGPCRSTLFRRHVLDVTSEAEFERGWESA